MVVSYKSFVPFSLIIFIDKDATAVMMLESHFLLCRT